MGSRWRTWDMECLDSTLNTIEGNCDQQLITPVGKDRGFSKLAKLSISSIVLPKAALISNHTVNDSDSNVCGRGRSLKIRALAQDKPGRRPAENTQTTGATSLGSKFLGSQYLYEELFPRLNETKSTNAGHQSHMPSTTSALCDNSRPKSKSQLKQPVNFAVINSESRLPKASLPLGPPKSCSKDQTLSKNFAPRPCYSDKAASSSRSMSQNAINQSCLPSAKYTTLTPRTATSSKNCFRQINSQRKSIAMQSKTKSTSLSSIAGLVSVRGSEKEFKNSPSFAPIKAHIESTAETKTTKSLSLTQLVPKSMSETKTRQSQEVNEKQMNHTPTDLLELPVNSAINIVAKPTDIKNQLTSPLNSSDTKSTDDHNIPTVNIGLSKSDYPLDKNIEQSNDSYQLAQLLETQISDSSVTDHNTKMSHDHHQSVQLPSLPEENPQMLTDSNLSIQQLSEDCNLEESTQPLLHTTTSDSSTILNTGALAAGMSDRTVFETFESTSDDSNLPKLNNVDDNIISPGQEHQSNIPQLPPPPYPSIDCSKEMLNCTTYVLDTCATVSDKSNHTSVDTDTTKVHVDDNNHQTCKPPSQTTNHDSENLPKTDDCSALSQDSTTKDVVNNDHETNKPPSQTASRDSENLPKNDDCSALSQDSTTKDVVNNDHETNKPPSQTANCDSENIPKTDDCSALSQDNTTKDVVNNDHETNKPPSQTASHDSENLPKTDDCSALSQDSTTKDVVNNDHETNKPPSQTANCDSENIPKTDDCSTSSQGSSVIDAFTELCGEDETVNYSMPLDVDEQSNQPSSTFDCGASTKLLSFLYHESIQAPGQFTFEENNETSIIEQQSIQQQEHSGINDAPRISDDNLLSLRTGTSDTNTHDVSSVISKLNPGIMDAERNCKDNQEEHLVEASSEEKLEDCEEIPGEPCNVKLENLPIALTEENLVEVIEPYGSMISCTFVEESTTSKSAIVRMGDSVTSEWLAASLDGLEMDGHRMRTVYNKDWTQDISFG